MSRRGLKLSLFACLLVLAAAVLFQVKWPHPLSIAEALYFLETGTAVGAIAIAIALIATV